VDKEGGQTMIIRNKLLAAFALVVAVAAGSVTSVQAANDSTLNQTINAGVLITDILDGSLNPVASPSINMTAKSFSFTCLSGGSASTGTFGTASERVYVTNPDAADNGWTLTLAATGGVTGSWVSGGNSFDFNDSGTSGCSDGGDADTKAGQLTVNPSAGTLTTDCALCAATNITKGSSAAFNQGTTDNITLLNAAAGSDDIWRGYLTGVSMSQVIPAETPSGAYTINMTMTATAQ